MGRWVDRWVDRTVGQTEGPRVDRTVGQTEDRLEGRMEDPRVDRTVGRMEDRLEGLKRIAETGLADAVVLDDGLQHRRLKPTVSLMLVDTTQPVDRDHFLPRGRLRDLPTRVPEADAVILTRCPSPYTKGDLRLWRHRLRLKPDQPLLHTGTQVDGLRVMTTKRYAGWPSSCIAVSGLANPAQFEHQLSRQCRVLSHFAYPDHHTFTEDDLREWAASLKKETAGRRPEAIITTEKDAERIRPLVAAAENGHAAVLQALLDSGADPDAATMSGSAPTRPTARTARPVRLLSRPTSCTALLARHPHQDRPRALHVQLGI